MSTSSISEINKLQEKISEWTSEGLFIFSEKNTLDSFVFNQPFRSSAFAVLLIKKGEYNLQCNLSTYALKEDSVFFVLPGSLYELLYISPDISFVGFSFHKDYLILQGVHFTSSETMRLFSSDIQPHCKLEKEVLTDLANAIVALEKKTKLSPQATYFREIIHHSFLSVLYDVALIFSHHNQLKKVRLNRKEELVSNFLHLLFVHFKKERSVQFYADALFITGRHLSQVVKEITGKTAGELIDEVVIKEAKVLLASPSMNVAQVTETLEFSNQSFFGKYFKTHTGISPSEYRANSRISNNPTF